MGQKSQKQAQMIKIFNYKRLQVMFQGKLQVEWVRKISRIS